MLQKNYLLRLQSSIPQTISIDVQDREIAIRHQHQDPVSVISRNYLDQNNLKLFSSSDRNNYSISPN